MPERDDRRRRGDRRGRHRSRSTCCAQRGYENVRVFASARSAGKQLGELHGRGGDAGSALARRRRRLPLLGRHQRVARARPARRARRRGRDRQVVGVSARARHPARRPRGERRARARARRHPREPELLHDPAHRASSSRCTRRPASCAFASPRTSRSPAPARRRWSGCATSRRPTTTCAWTGTSTARSSTRSRSSAPRRGRSWSFPICRSRRPACACR